jgi:arylsulfatase A
LPICHGPAITPQHPHGSAGPLRNKKGSVFEGGIREPGIIRWPGKTQAGSTSDEPVCGVDFLPTVCEITGLNIPSDRKIDGASMLPVLSGGKVSRSTPLYWHFNQAAGGPQIALRSGDWKVLATLDKPGAAGIALSEQTEGDFKSAEPVEYQLYNLHDDIGETHDLAKTQPEKFNEMKALVLAKYHDVRAESPTWPTWAPPVPAGKKKK